MWVTLAMFRTSIRQFPAKLFTVVVNIFPSARRISFHVALFASFPSVPLQWRPLTSEAKEFS
jgi:hypothetical protein